MGRAASLLLLAVDGLLAQLARHSPSTAALQECMHGLVSHLDLAQQRLGALLAEAEASEHGVAGRFDASASAALKGVLTVCLLSFDIIRA